MESSSSRSAKHDIVRYTLSPKYLPTNVRYIRFTKPCINDSASFPLLERLTTEGRTGKNLAISHLDWSVLYSPEPHEVELIIAAMDYFFKNPIDHCLP